MTTERNSRAISGTECRVTSVDGEKKDRGISGENRAEESVVLSAETEEKKRRMIRRLLTWYHENRRILPWRDDPTPYHVWLSEIMLQQTRVEAVKEYYARFLSALPDISSLAAAPEDQVMKLWEGLGYYSRARNLQKAAKVVCSEYQGRMPETASALRKLPGIGAYTAAAIASIACGEPEPALDGNLMRVFARVTRYEEEISQRAARETAEEFYRGLFTAAGKIRQETARISAGDGTVSGQSSNLYGTLNQALMDLGATVCLPNGAPVCGACPWSACCMAHLQLPGRETDLPKMPVKKPRKIQQYTVFLLQDADRIALRRRPPKGLLAGLFGFPMAEGHLTDREALEYVRGLGFSPIRIEDAGAARHIFTHVEWDMVGYAVRVDEFAKIRYDSNGGEDDIILAGTDEIRGRYPIPSAFRHYREWILNRTGGWQ